ncbi:hypothetical protein COO91_04937 [Nostoc flagelliforme CCNUN1]|uniref:Uncharacterized protein n=1 Tax=Nostoc flagelliforme CCNUN1 TaxID=2038116 RepID=A0A2K8SU68_9NOSO|nr:hypothetical protein COO91_04937 [Nostoc flagelliforme CCNUN1]
MPNTLTYLDFSARRYANARHESLSTSAQCRIPTPLTIKQEF